MATKEKREHRVEVRFSNEELQCVKDLNISSVGRFVREATLEVVSQRLGEEKAFKEKRFSKVDRDFILELSRIGGNLNQITRAVNTDLANNKPVDAIRLLRVLMMINQNLEELRNDR